MPMIPADDAEVALLGSWVDQVLAALDDVEVMFVSDESCLSDFWSEDRGDKNAWAARIGDKLGLEGVTYNNSRIVDLARRLRELHLH